MTSSPQVRGISGIDDVVARHLCAGCGVCAGVQPRSISMTESADGFRRPAVSRRSDGEAPDTTLACSVCPGIHLEHQGQRRFSDEIWGPVLEVWEGWATDPDVRFAGSSGGVVTALAIHQLERGEADGVIHTRADPANAYRLRTMISTSRDEVLDGAGSRYAPASPAEGLADLTDTRSCVVFIGKPCDVAGVANASRAGLAASERVRLTIGIFCAGTPSWEGTRQAVAAAGIDPDEATSVHYRGRGWPGRFTVADRQGHESSLSYAESWGDILQQHRQWRCRICPDHTGEFADIAVGDPWYRPVAEDDPGSSLVVVRSERGRVAVQAAIEDGAVELRRVDRSTIDASQPNLAKLRGSVGGRLAIMRLLGMPTPRFRGLPMARAWWRLSAREKAQSTAGTARRLVTRGLWRPGVRVSTDPAEHRPAGR